jgi:hypothetical protein
MKDTSECTFSPCRQYRYTLLHRWRHGRPLIWIGLNPSTADERTLDPTLRNVRYFSQREDFGAFLMLNLYAYRSPKPSALLEVADPMGPDNLETLRRETAGAIVVCCWGNSPAAKLLSPDLIKSILPAHDAILCLGTNKDGSPRHPLYLPHDTPFTLFRH